MPGARQLASELGVDRKTVEAGLCLLMQEGLLMAQGAGRRKIVLPEKLASPSLRLAVLEYEPATKSESYMVEMQQLLTKAGYVVFSAPKSLLELGMEVVKIEKMVKKIHADAWMVVSGSREVLEWFAGQAFPTFALFGRRRGLPLAEVGQDKPPAMGKNSRSG